MPKNQGRGNKNQMLAGTSPLLIIFLDVVTNPQQDINEIAESESKTCSLQIGGNDRISLS
jgi:hypothetical protein